ncbi:MAG: hypothetical protein WBN04_04035 [Paracoccaceae bacterium]
MSALGASPERVRAVVQIVPDSRTVLRMSDAWNGASWNTDISKGGLS